MEISIITFILWLLVAFVVGSCIGYFLRLGLHNVGERIKKIGSTMRDRLVDYWYVLVFVVVSIYVLSHFNECIALSFTEDFNGKNLLFLFWLALIVFPMFESFEGFGISIKKRKQNKGVQSLTDDYHAQVRNVQEIQEVQHE